MHDYRIGIEYVICYIKNLLLQLRLHNKNAWQESFLIAQM